jgi:type I restriction enzyme R subunit
MGHERKTNYFGEIPVTTDTSEKGLETIIMRYMTGVDGLFSDERVKVVEVPASYGGTGWFAGNPFVYDRNHALDTPHLFAFLKATQPDSFKKLKISDCNDMKDISLLKFLARLSSEIGNSGIIDVLRHGIKYGDVSLDLFYGTPSPGNEKAVANFAKNRFSVTRQLRYSMDETRRALDLCLFINGLPIATFELKNSLTKQTVEDAIEQYKRDRDPRERLFEFGRCIVHLAVDDHEAMMCTHLKGKGSWFLPLNQGWNDGAGNPPNPDGLKTDYLWKQILTPKGLTDIIENYAQVVKEKNPKTKREKKTQIFPRYHQLDVVRKILADVTQNGAGKRYLIQHSAGSGKSNSIAWLSNQLIGLRKEDKNIFDSIIVVTDRRILDQQIKATIKQFAQVGETVGHAEHSGNLRKFIQGGKKIIISTVQKFPFILDEIGDEHRGRNFAILIDEAHSSQGGKVAGALNEALSDPEDTINDALEKRMQARKMLTNASYFAFTATPKNKTLEMFGEPEHPDSEGKIKHTPFHCYSMKQAIQEGFILDVLKSYTPVDSYYRLVKTIEGDPEVDTKKAKKKIRHYVESHEHAISIKAEIMVDHFHEQVMALNKIGGQARAMLVCSGIERAIQYFHRFREYLKERKSPYQAIVAFSGEYEYGGAKVSESSLNGFSSGDIADKIKEDPYRFLICADKFQTGYDEPLLHTMYVDKHQAYSLEQVESLVSMYLNGADRDKLDPILDICVANYISQLDEDGQVNFKGNAKSFTRTYDFLASILPYTYAEWEKLSIFLNLLIPKLPAPVEEDLAKGILEAIDMDSYRAEKKAVLKMPLPDDNAEINPAPVSEGGRKSQPELDRLSNIIKTFNEQFGTLFADADRIARRITEDIAPKAAVDQPYQNAIKNTPNAARIELDAALMRVIGPLLKDDTEFYKQFVQNESFKRFVTDTVIAITSNPMVSAY